jgi:two-component system, NtrC family, response regulator AtoC
LSESGEILITGEDSGVVSEISRRLSARGHGAVVMPGGEACIERFVASGSDAIVACLPLGDMGGGTFLSKVRDSDRSVNVIVTGSDRQIVSSMSAYELGAFEYVADPIDRHEDLLAAVGMALGSRRGDLQLRYLRQKDAADASAQAFVGQCPEMLGVLRIVRLVCSRTAEAGAAPTILITGETGTGKGMLAKFIHYNGGRRNRPFVEVNCAAIPAQLLEAELFGHERGAFTDARSRRAGLLETSHEGTLFLDEIGSMSLAVQAKLLTAIEEKRFRRVGSPHSLTVDTQILAATHTHLKRAVAAGEFRADLYHRLNVVSVSLPPLRARGDDKLILAERFMLAMCREYGLPPRRFSERAKSYILDYLWPGNVRELRNQIERIVLLHNQEEIQAEHFDVANSIKPPDSDRFTLSLPEGGMSLGDIEKEAISRALERFDGNVSQAARYLHVTRQTLIYRMKKYRLRGD